MLKNKLFSIAEDIIKVAENDGTEVVVFGERSRLSRFALSRIHQNTEVEDVRVLVRVRFGKRSVQGSMSFKGERRDLVEFVKKLESLAKFSPDNPDLPELPESAKVEVSLDSFDEYTANIPPEDMLRTVEKLINGTPKPFEAFGVVSVGSLEYVFLTSSGFEGYNVLTDANVKYNPMSGTRSYIVQTSARTFKDINILNILSKVDERLKFLSEPEDARPGEWDVILEPLAVTELLIHFNWFALSGKLAVENRTPLIHKIGEKIFSENINLVDDPLNPRGFVIPFDFEGRKRGITPVIENGMFKSFANDSITARKLNMPNNACAMFPFMNYPLFANLHLRGGETPYDEIIESTSNGLIITRFWYINLVDVKSITLTGMTRDGVFIVRDGKIVGSMKNMRFNDSILRVLANVEGISSEEELVGEPTWYDMHFPNGIIVPTLKVKNFKFSSATSF